MGLLRIFDLITIVLIIATLVISVTSEEKPEKYIVALKPLSSIASSGESHYEWLSKQIKKLNINSISPLNAKVKAFTEGGVLDGYTAWLPKSFAENDLNSRSEVKYVELDAKVSINYAVPRTVQKKPNPNLDRLDQKAFPLNNKFAFPESAGLGVDIYVIDTGILVTHKEFENRARFGAALCEGCPDTDDNGHGSHVSGIAAGKTFGVAKRANLIGVKVLDAAGSGANSDVIDGMNFVLEDRKKSKNATIVNMSLGGIFSQAVNDATKKLTDNGVHVVVAAGNEAADACGDSPSSELTAVTVGATEENDDNIAFFSNIGKCVDIFAPGSNILSVGIESDTSTAIFSGTSQASPHVAGTLALMIAKDGYKSPAELTKDLLDLSTKNVVKGLDGDTSNNFLRVPAP
ncbi:hypothetical protein Glove_295g35 [Diversispora epigaea]|uniref:Peptidase S8/S53 domain-containing protein n=1 Tax=Diversispora epigaea TaxID=1348612 RepID=A0A397HZF2_9GLOM|nr:hypothetical protein Glove_295g35 [Diversispora epigaea]